VKPSADNSFFRVKIGGKSTKQHSSHPTMPEQRMAKIGTKIPLKMGSQTAPELQKTLVNRGFKEDRPAIDGQRNHSKDPYI
jgi:hypothetical protein